MPETLVTRDLPIPFDRASNILALLAGRKFETRRLMRPQPRAKEIAVVDPYNKNYHHFTAWTADNRMCLDEGNIKNTCHWKPPHGVPGDRLWVREALVQRGGPWYYRADGKPVLVDPKNETEMVTWAHHKESRHCSSRYMPRFAARIMLRISGLRCERLWAITEEGAKAEGVQELWLQKGEPGAWWTHDQSDNDLAARTPRDAFRKLWNSINGYGDAQWAKNPWVWVYTFRVAVTSHEGKGGA